MEIIIDHLRRMREFDSINTQFEKGETVLHMACRNGNFKIVKMLVDLMNPDKKIKYFIHSLYYIILYIEMMQVRQQEIMQ